MSTNVISRYKNNSPSNSNSLSTTQLDQRYINTEEEIPEPQNEQDICNKKYCDNNKKEITNHYMQVSEHYFQTQEELKQKIIKNETEIEKIKIPLSVVSPNTTEIREIKIGLAFDSINTIRKAQQGLQFLLFSFQLNCKIVIAEVLFKTKNRSWVNFTRLNSDIEKLNKRYNFNYEVKIFQNKGLYLYINKRNYHNNGRIPDDKIHPDYLNEIKIRYLIQMKPPNSEQGTKLPLQKVAPSL